MRFYLNGIERELPDDSADLTLLNVLRAHPTLKGTKEGCASGDCGACTLLVGRQVPTRGWHYQAVNSCLLLMAQLEGASVITVEALPALSGGTLHPAQQALIDFHGSQCGFCTPGIVMSMSALYEETGALPPSDEQIRFALAGNLCRCTGYRPILDAARHMKDCVRSSSPVSLWHPEQNLEPASPFTALTEAQLQNVLALTPQARILAGGTDLGLEVSQQMRRLSPLIYIGQIASLKVIEASPTHLRLGAACTYEEIGPVLSAHFPEFGYLLSRLGSRQVRNLGTLGGNIANASPVGDTPPVLIALGAVLELASHRSTRQIPVAEFFLGYKHTGIQQGEYIRAIQIPRLSPDECLKVFKISKRIHDDISTVLMALKLKVHGDRILQVASGFGGMAAIPQPAPRLEEKLRDQPLCMDSFARAAKALDQDFAPLSDVRASASYRLQVAKQLLRKCYYELTGADFNGKPEVTRVDLWEKPDA